MDGTRIARRPKRRLSASPTRPSRRSRSATRRTTRSKADDRLRLVTASRDSTMSLLAFTAALWLGSPAAGPPRAPSRLGGGVVIVPLLILMFRVDVHYAIGASLVSVIATSSGAAAAYVREGYSNIRGGMFLEIATTIGALTGALVAVHLRVSVISVIFGIVLLYSAYASLSDHPPTSANAKPDRIASWLRMDSTYPTPNGPESYHVRGVPLGFALMFVAGVLSGLLGIGSGAV